MLSKVWIGDNLLTFDGDVLELFGHPATPSARFHIDLLDLEVGDPDGKERRSLTLKASTKHSGGIQISIPPEDWPSAEPFLDGVLSVMPE